MARISQRSEDLIVEAEVSGRAYFEKHYQRPDWPGDRSGVTVAIGYDLGWASPEKIKRDWASHVSPAMLAVMVSCSGVHGSAAKGLCASVRDKILIPWDAAVAVFEQSDLPEYTDGVCKAIPGADKLQPDCLGAVVSLGFNRGYECFEKSGDRYVECRNIRAYIMAGRLDLVPGQFRKMERLWSDGLVHRRELEAQLWETGLKAPQVAPLADVPAPTVSETPPVTMPTESGNGKHVGGGMVVAGGGAIMRYAHHINISTPDLVLIGAAVAVVALAVWLALHQLGSRPVLARAKDIQGDAT